MKVELFALADYANQTIEGRLNILGLFSQINWIGPNTVLPHMYIALVLTAEDKDFNTLQQFRLTLVDPDGNDVVTALDLETRVPPAPKRGRLSQIQLAGLMNTLFRTAGTYSFNLYIGEDLAHSQTVELIEPLET